MALAGRSFHPDLGRARFLPPLSFGPATAALLRRARPRPATLPAGVSAIELRVPGPTDAPEVGVRMLRPARAEGAVPLLLWVHGGGHVIGSPEQDDRSNIRFVEELGIAVAAVRYRLAPVAPAPAAVEDARAALVGVLDRAEELGVDPGRVAIGGASAGAGIAAALAQLLHDEGGPRALLQLLVYPMLDDRTVTRTDLETRNVRGWTPRSNRFGWSQYLGVAPGSAAVPQYAAPARRADLSGLPPAWIGVGTLDLFHDEDLAYARRLRDAGVPCAVHVVPGAFHGFDAILPDVGVSRSFHREQTDALRGALGIR